jgi:C4-dicarboxylate transporter
MFKFISKHRLFFGIVGFIACGLVSYFKFNDYFNVEFKSLKQKNMSLFAAIVFGILALIRLVELFEGLKKKKAE